jgi:hypothetical protein
LKEYVLSLLNLLVDLRGAEFDLLRVAFCEPETDSEAAIESELGARLVKVLRSHSNLIEFSWFLPFMDRIAIDDVKLEIYGATNKMGEALEIIWPDMDKCEAFCCKNPVAFQHLFGLIRKEFSEKLRTTEILRLISRNAAVIDVAAALEHVDAEISLDEVSESLEKCYRDLVTRRREAEIEAALTFSKGQEMEFERVKVECECLALKRDCKCAKCGKDVNFRFVERSVGGQVYHLQCAPR